MMVPTPCGPGLMSRISTIKLSPGSAPRTATGPVAGLTRSKSISVTRSLSVCIWPEKQSWVSKVTTSPGSTSRTGFISGPKLKTASSFGITWSTAPAYRCINPPLLVDQRSISLPSDAAQIGAPSGLRYGPRIRLPIAVGEAYTSGPCYVSGIHEGGGVAGLEARRRHRRGGRQPGLVPEVGGGKNPPAGPARRTRRRPRLPGVARGASRRTRGDLLRPARLRAFRQARRRLALEDRQVRGRSGRRARGPGARRDTPSRPVLGRLAGHRVHAHETVRRGRPRPG